MTETEQLREDHQALRKRLHEAKNATDDLKDAIKRAIKILASSDNPDPDMAFAVLHDSLNTKVNP